MYRYDVKTLYLSNITFQSFIKHPTTETIKPKNELPTPNAVAYTLDVNIIALPKSITEIPKRTLFILPHLQSNHHYELIIT